MISDQYNHTQNTNERSQKQIIGNAFQRAFAAFIVCSNGNERKNATEGEHNSNDGRPCIDDFGLFSVGNVERSKHKKTKPQEISRRAQYML